MHGANILNCHGQFNNLQSDEKLVMMSAFAVRSYRLWGGRIQETQQRRLRESHTCITNLCLSWCKINPFRGNPWSYSSKNLDLSYLFLTIKDLVLAWSRVLIRSRTYLILDCLKFWQVNSCVKTMQHLELCLPASEPLCNFQFFTFRVLLQHRYKMK